MREAPPTPVRGDRGHPACARGDGRIRSTRAMRAACCGFGCPR